MNPEEFISSFSFDKRLAPYDIRGSIAHATMLARKRIISPAESKRIIRGLLSIQKDIERGKAIPPAEDIHYAVERELIRRIGKTAKKMHTARSRNDQVVTDLKLFVRDAGGHILEAIRAFQEAVLMRAEAHPRAILPGFTHLQHGQPVFFAHHILSYAWMLERDKGRVRDALKRADECPLGVCALAGTTFPIDRSLTARLLGFSRVSENSIDTVSDRDFAAEFIFACAMIGVHLSRLGEELVIWSSTEFGFVSLSDPFTSGSSIMPQKRNPDTAELLRGKSARAIGGLAQILSLLKGQPLSYNRDLQEDKPPLFDAADTALASLDLARQILDGLRVNEKTMEASCHGGYLLATELADYLARKGLPFREAHGIVSDMVRELREGPEGGGNLEDYTLEELKSFSPLFGPDVARVFSIRRVAEDRNSYGGTGKKALARQIRKLKTLLKR